MTTNQGKPMPAHAASFTDLTDADLARTLATEAGQLLIALRTEGEVPEGKDLARSGDSASQHFLARQLRENRPGDAVLSEEAADDAARLGADRVWIIDPLDGTREYSEHRHDWAVHVALWERGELVAGAVALPALDLTLTSQDAPAPRGEVPLNPRFVVSRSRATELTVEVARECGGELLTMGSAGFKACAVVRGEAEVYLHSGGQYEWDSAAPVAVARAAGLHVSRIDGSPLVYNRPDPYLPDVLVCRPELAEQVLAVLRRQVG